MRDDKVIAPDLLAWYDRHARDLPWRNPPGVGGADPYRVWLSEVMLQQTTVAAVKGYFHRFTTRWPTVQALAEADDADVMAEWAGLGYYARARNLLACARAVAGAGFPTSRTDLLKLPGIGPYTAAAIAAIAHDASEVVVDGNVERVVARLFALRDPLPGAKPRLVEFAEQLTPLTRPGDYAQAMMDLGATICTPRNPTCTICPIRPHCDGFAQGIAPDLPAKSPKPEKPTRQGVAWVGISSQGVLLETRPAKGLLGGTLAFPSTGWDGSDAEPPARAGWALVGQVRHTFTHFHLELAVHVARLTSNPERGSFTAIRDFDPQNLPGLMRKVWDAAKPTLQPHIKEAI